MKKISATARLATILICFCLPASLMAQKNYISIESGFAFGGSTHKIQSQMNASGFGDDIVHGSGIIGGLISDFFSAFGINVNTSSIEQYPHITSKEAPLWIRYGRELKNKKIMEISYGNMHNGTISGFDLTSATQNNDYDGNHLQYTIDLTAITAHYIFSTKNNSAGIGFGPALVFNALTTKANYSTDKKNIFQPGVSATANWRFINKKVFFMSLRGDAIMLAPATIDAITLTSTKGYNSTFNTTKANSFIGDLTISAGFKF